MPGDDANGEQHKFDAAFAPLGAVRFQTEAAA
jgi:hypothetical protein